MFDTMLGADDYIPIKAIGDNKGMYIDSDGLILNFYFNVPAGPDNWKAGNYRYVGQGHILGTKSGQFQSVTSNWG